MDMRLQRVEERADLATFVRSCRERARPEDFGLPPGRRRRTKGLRREEVATLAGVGLTWYTWFEQGRDISVTDDFLHRLSRGLRLGRAEQEHLFALAGRDQMSGRGTGLVLPSGLDEIVLSLPGPAYLLDRRWDVLAFNDASAKLFPDFRGEEPNMLRITFFSKAYRRIARSWEEAARAMLLKARHDYLTGGQDPRLRAVVEEILAALPQARAWWDDPEIIRIGDTVKDLRDPEQDWKRYRLKILSCEDRPDIRLVVYLAGT